MGGASDNGLDVVGLPPKILGFLGNLTDREPGAKASHGPVLRAAGTPGVRCPGRPVLQRIVGGARGQSPRAIRGDPGGPPGRDGVDLDLRKFTLRRRESGQTAAERRRAGVVRHYRTPTASKATASV